MFWEIPHSSSIPDIGPVPKISQKQVVQIDVWQNVPVINPSVTGTYISAAAYIDLPGHARGSPFPAGDLAGFDTTSPGRYKSGFWTRLDPSKDYRYDRYGGYVTILTNVNDAQAYAVNYTTADNTVYAFTP